LPPLHLRRRSRPSRTGHDPAGVNRSRPRREDLGLRAGRCRRRLISTCPNRTTYPARRRRGTPVQPRQRMDAVPSSTTASKILKLDAAWIGAPPAPSGHGQVRRLERSTGCSRLRSWRIGKR
jgi:hypothetical protein